MTTEDGAIDFRDYCRKTRLERILWQAGQTESPDNELVRSQTEGEETLPQ